MKLPLIFSRPAWMAMTVIAALPFMAARATAGDIAAGDLQLLPPLSVEDSVMLAQADTANSNDADYDSLVTKNKPFLTGKSLHQYLGLGSLAFAIAAAATAPDNEGGVKTTGSKLSTHRALGITAAALGGAAIVNGFYVNGDDFDLRNGLMDPDNLHVLMGILGTLGYIAAVATKGKGGHAAAGAGGAALMGVGIALEW